MRRAQLLLQLVDKCYLARLHIVVCAYHFYLTLSDKFFYVIGFADACYLRMHIGMDCFIELVAFTYVIFYVFA